MLAVALWTLNSTDVRLIRPRGTHREGQERLARFGFVFGFRPILAPQASQSGEHVSEACLDSYGLPRKV